MCIRVPSTPKQARQFELQVKDWKASQESFAIVTMVLPLVDHIPLKFSWLRGMFCSVGVLLLPLVCCNATKCDSGSKAASFCFSLSLEGVYVRFEDEVGCAMVMLRELLAGGFEGAPAGCFLLYLVKAIFVRAGEGDFGRHVEELVRVTMLRFIFLRVSTNRSSPVVNVSSRRVLERWCRLLRCLCLTGSESLRCLLIESSELADSVAE